MSLSFSATTLMGVFLSGRVMLGLLGNEIVRD